MAYCVVVKAQNSCKNSETGLLCRLILRQAHTEAHGLIVWGRVLEWCLKSFWYISHPIKSMPHYGIGIWLSVELDERCLWWLTQMEVQSQVWPPDKSALLLSASQNTRPFLLPPCPALQPLFFAPYQPAPTTWTLAFLSFIFPFFLQGMILSYIFNLHLISDVSQSFSGSTLLVTLVHLSHSILATKYLNINSLFSHLKFSF